MVDCAINFFYHDFRSKRFFISDEFPAVVMIGPDSIVGLLLRDFTSKIILFSIVGRER
jgi:hypothetical protein